MVVSLGRKKHKGRQPRGESTDAAACEVLKSAQHERKREVCLKCMTISREDVTK
jgi:hypothetical protein